MSAKESSGMDVAHKPPTHEVYQKSGNPGLEFYVRTIPPYNEEVQQELIDQAKAGVAGAREKLIENNLRLVVKIAGEFADLGLPILDLINEGNIELTEIVDSIQIYDPIRASFATFSRGKIRRRMKRALTAQVRLVTMHRGKVDQKLHFIRVRDRLSTELERKPTVSELASAMDLSEFVIKRIIASIHSLESLDESQGDDDHILADLVADPNVVLPSEMVEQKDALSILDRGLSGGILDDMERFVLRHRFSLDEYKEMTFKELSKLLGMGVSGVQYHQSKALEKLRRLFVLAK
ncbi:MAG: sigma-70 family RNA polymerase sigma factor [Candidatus Taylorbacteria bacterium]|nr:sigma-70 family RNA polymerase sigma factor [Candidatus Taylorbacteria bacterium]